MKCPVCRKVWIAKGEEMCQGCRRDYGRVMRLNDTMGLHHGNVKIEPQMRTKYQQDKFRAKERREK